MLPTRGLQLRIEDASLRNTNLRGANLQNASLQRSILDEADLTAADLRGADLAGTSLEDADLRKANLDGLKWNALRSVKGANFDGVQNAPSGFLTWALSHGAIAKSEEP